MITDEDAERGVNDRAVCDRAWRRGRDVLDAYDADRVLSESLADDLVNDLVGLHAAVPTRWRRRVARPPRPSGRRPHLRLMAGGLNRPEPA